MRSDTLQFLQITVGSDAISWIIFEKRLEEINRFLKKMCTFAMKVAGKMCDILEKLT